MYLKNSHILQDFKVPKFFENKISISCDDELTEPEIDSFNIALYLLSKFIDTSSSTPNLLSINVYFCCHKNPTFIIEETNNETFFGSFDQIIIYPVWKWREHDFPGWVILLPMIEELCHAIYLIPDGPLVDQKVTEILQILGNNDTYSTYLKEIEKFVRNAHN